MSDFQLYKKNPTAGEITSSLTGSNDGQGLHFDGAANTFVDCGVTTILDGASRMSVEVISATSSTTASRIIGKQASDDGFKLQQNADGTLSALVANGLTTCERGRRGWVLGNRAFTIRLK